MSGPKAAASPIYRTIQGKEYSLSPPSAGDLAEFQRYIQDQEMELAKRNAASLPMELAKELILHAHDRAAKKSFARADYIEAMCTVGGGLRIIHLCIRRKHPDVTFEDVCDMIPDPESIAKLVNDIPMDTPEDPPKKKPVRKAARKKKKAERKRKKQ